MSEEILGNRYVIRQQLAKKAGRRTLLAQDKNTDNLVVIKLLSFSSDFTWEDLKLFEREAETLKSLSHPAIPGYIDYLELDTNQKTYALVQTYVDGKSLETDIQSGRVFTEKELKIIAKKLLDLLIYLHAQHPPVIHRDIKPSNIILQENRSGGIGQVYLVDFGSVQTLTSKAGKTVTVVGTYGYMPPEQFGGYASPASDLYSLGATLITLGTGIHPADLPQKEMKIAFEKLVNFSPDFVTWLQYLTEPSQDQRLNSAAEALFALENKYIPHPNQASTSKRVNTWWLFIIGMSRTTIFGGGMVTICAGLYSSIFVPIIGTMMGAVIGGMLAFPLAIFNGFLNALITRFFFYPLRNTNLHQRVLSLITMTISIAIAVVYFSSMNTTFPFHEGLISNYLGNLIFMVVTPSIITGLSMGASSKSFARWYEKECRVIAGNNRNHF